MAAPEITAIKTKSVLYLILIRKFQFNGKKYMENGVSLDGWKWPDVDQCLQWTSGLSICVVLFYLHNSRFVYLLAIVAEKCRFVEDARGHLQNQNQTALTVAP